MSDLTGWFGRPGVEGGRIHIVRELLPICGTRLHPDAQFQFCATGVNRSMVECERCKKKIEGTPNE